MPVLEREMEEIEAAIKTISFKLEKNNARGLLMQTMMGSLQKPASASVLGRGLVLWEATAIHTQISVQQQALKGSEMIHQIRYTNKLYTRAATWLWFRLPSSSTNPTPTLHLRLGCKTQGFGLGKTQSNPPNLL
ncbi:hypothetical protein MRB53_020173 [Persea americana]|uniref:Uncharacterized protein n=1 Tax=Persea americana TaxID=3435 RepID=A0ACC2L0F2_PERAE|nr:hypothetical protein MRB53_020173 [Persea americana]|eukprot:TRINITY_DN5194_c1_g1_i12.p1 TRINITY_DN5194_c1_g1~~TRINITY_DN5194_c1_g1_i12.p1  ORF type:complete len:134 (+),score=17.71 TRINITY_DN5194_c1_g1_i12:256-657(+)